MTQAFTVNPTAKIIKGTAIFEDLFINSVVLSLIIMTTAGNLMIYI